jgi:hypothetical protein
MDRAEIEAALAEYDRDERLCPACSEHGPERYGDNCPAGDGLRWLRWLLAALQERDDLLREALSAFDAADCAGDDAIRTRIRALLERGGK